MEVNGRWQDAAERDARNKDAAQRERQALVAADLADARAIQAASRVQARAAQVPCCLWGLL